MADKPSSPFSRTDSFGKPEAPREAPRAATGGLGSGMAIKSFGAAPEAGGKSAVGGFGSGISTNTGSSAAVRDNPFKRKSAVDEKKQTVGEGEKGASLRPGDHQTKAIKAPGSPEQPKQPSVKLGFEAEHKPPPENTPAPKIVTTDKGLEIAQVKATEAEDFQKRLEASATPAITADTQMTIKNYTEVYKKQEELKIETHKIETHKIEAKRAEEQSTKIFAGQEEAVKQRRAEEAKNAAYAHQARGLQAQIAYYNSQLTPNDAEANARIQTMISSLSDQLSQIPSAFRG